MTEDVISHAIVLPDRDFANWLDAISGYINHFEKVAVLRSPTSNDLNRYRDITAVQAPLVWFQNDAVAHIRRIYPMVVRIDVIHAQSPSQLKKELNKRVRQNDRYGEKRNEPRHLYDRFIIEYPSQHRPMQIIKEFDQSDDPETRNEGIDIAIHKGEEVTAAATGKVTKITQKSRDHAPGFQTYVQVRTRHGSIRYIVTYLGLDEVTVLKDQRVQAGDVIGTAATDHLKLIIQESRENKDGKRKSRLLDPAHVLYITGLQVRSITNRLRIRTLPNIQSEIIGHMDLWDMYETLEPHGQTLAKVGIDDKWIRIKQPIGKPGYVAAWYLQAATEGDTPIVFPGVNPVGVNLDQSHRLGAPEPSRLGGLGWVRIGYNVSNFVGSTDIQAAFDRYRPVAEKYVRAGYKVMFVTSHQTYGEGRTEYFDADRGRWMRPIDGRWIDLADRFTDMMGKIAAQWAGTGLVHAWQVWNEQDTHEGAEAAIPISAFHYANLLTKSIQVIKTAHPDVYVITGGHTGGPGNGANYARQTLGFMSSRVRPDGIAFHPYGRGTNPGDPYTQFGHIDESIRQFGAIMPDRPLWITEWGVLNALFAPANEIADYATQFVKHLKVRYPGRIATMIWFAWADTMHNGYGLVDQNNQPKSDLYDRFIRA